MVRIEEVDLGALPDERLRPLADLLQTLATTAIPEDPSVPYEVRASRLRAVAPSIERHTWLASEGEAVVGWANASRLPTGDNPHLCEMQLQVHPEWRCHGIGTALLARVADAVAGVQDALLTSWTMDRVPAGEAFARRIGAEPAIATRTNQLELAAVDHALLAEWRGLAETEAADYRLEWIPTPVPEEWVDRVIAIVNVMNTAPRGSLQVRDFILTRELLREWEAWGQAAGVEIWFLIALHRETGEPAGYTQVGYDERLPHVVQQHGTAVAPAHRGKGLGKLVKAEMLARILAERPQARYVRTGNANENAPMLHINERLGFRHAWSNTTWQARLPVIRAYLDSVPAPVRA